MKTITLLFTMCLLGAMPLLSQTSSIIPNHGQWQEEIKFVANSGNNSIWMTDKGLVYRVFEDAEDSLGTVIRCDYVDANSFDIEYKETSAYYNYMLGNDPEKWRKKVPLCTAAEAKNVFENVDIKYFFQNSNLRYDFYLRKNAKPETIKLKFSGHEKLYVDKGGNLIIQTKSGDIKHGSLRSYKSDEILAANQIESSFKILDQNTVSFQVAETEEPNMVIDPVIFGSYYGGLSDDTPFDSKYMDNGKLIITGRTHSNPLPLSPDALDTMYINKSRGYIAVFDTENQNFLYATLWGSGTFSSVYFVDTDTEENVYIVASSDNNLYYKTEDAFNKDNLSDDTNVSCFTVFTPKIDSVIYSTAFSTNSEMINFNRMVVKNNLAYFIGGHVLINDDYKIRPTENAYKADFDYLQSSTGYWANSCIAAFDYKSSSFKYFTYIGKASTWLTNLKISDNNNIYVEGYFDQNAITVTEGAYNNITEDAGYFVAKFDSSLTENKYTAGIANREYGSDRYFDIALYQNEDVAIVSNALHPQFSKDKYNSYFECDDPAYSELYTGTSATKLNSEGTEVVGAVYIEHFVINNNEDIKAAIDKFDNLYIGTHAAMSYLPTTSNHICNSFYADAATPIYITVFDKNLDTLKYGTYLCGNGESYVKDIDINSEGNLSILAYTFADENLPLSNGGFNKGFGDMDSYILVLKPDFETGVAEEIFYNNFAKAYPNPISNGALSIDFDQPENISSVELYNYMGELVRSYTELGNTYSNNLQLEIGTHPPGAYVVRVKCADKIISKNIIIE